MRSLALALALALAGASPALAEPTDDALKHLRGKIAVDQIEMPDKQGKDLAKHLEERLTGRTLRREPDGTWSLYFYAVFTKEAAKGPITIVVLDKADMSEPVSEASLPSDEKVWRFRGVAVLDENLGFNKGRRYEVRVGQIFGKKFTSYAKGEVALE